MATKSSLKTNKKNMIVMNMETATRAMTNSIIVAGAKKYIQNLI